MRRRHAASLLVAATALVGCRTLTPREDALDALLASYFPDPDGPGGVVLLASGRFRLERAYGRADVETGREMTERSIFEIGSISKQFTAVAILKLVELGALSLDDDVRARVPELDAHGERITIEQVLTHTSGLPNLVDRPDFDALLMRDHTPRELLELTWNEPLRFPPGTGFYYSDSGYILLGLIIERVTGIPYGEYVELELLQPLGMYDTFYADPSRRPSRTAKGYTVEGGAVVPAPAISLTVPYSAGALASTARNLLLWDRALRAGRVVSPALLEAAWRPRVLPDGTPSGYGFGWKACSLDGHRTIEHGGFIPGFTSAALRLPDDDLNVIVLLNTDAGPGADAIARRLARVFLAGTSEPRTRALGLGERAALVGTYRIGPQDTRTIYEDGVTLFLQRNTSAPVELAALGPTELTPAGSDATIVYEFELGPDGRATRMWTLLSCEPLDSAVREDDEER